MKKYRFAGPVSGCRLFSLWCLFLAAPLFLAASLMAAPLMGEQFEEEVSTKEYLFVKGIIESVSDEDQTIKLKQKKGPTITFSIDQDTLLEGFYKLSDLEPRQNIKVWYRPDGQMNKALKILKPLDLGC